MLIRLLYYLPMERMKTQVELLKECCDIKDAACVKYQKRIAELEEENENLKAIIEHYKKFEEGKNKLKEVYIKNTAKFLDKKFPAINGFMEEDTLQELRDLGKI